MPKFSCELCNYQTDKKFNYMNHLESKKHEQKSFLHKQVKITKYGDGEVEVDSKNKFFCETCNFVCYKISNYEKHLKTEKHILANSSTKCNISESFVCKICNSEYSSRSGLWRHKQKCYKTSKHYQCENEKHLYENENENEHQRQNPRQHPRQHPRQNPRQISTIIASLLMKKNVMLHPIFPNKSILSLVNCNAYKKRTINMNM